MIYSTETEGVQIVGTISAYVSNKASGDPLPGLSIARDVSHFHDTITMIKDLYEAKEKKIAEKHQQATTTQETPPSIEGTPKTTAEE